MTVFISHIKGWGVHPASCSLNFSFDSKNPIYLRRSRFAWTLRSYKIAMLRGRERERERESAGWRGRAALLYH